MRSSFLFWLRRSLNDTMYADWQHEKADVTAMGWQRRQARHGDSAQAVGSGYRHTLPHLLSARVYRHPTNTGTKKRSGQ
jgi:hypothetical protein